MDEGIELNGRVVRVVSSGPGGPRACMPRRNAGSSVAQSRAGRAPTPHYASLNNFGGHSSCVETGEYAKAPLLQEARDRTKAAAGGSTATALSLNSLTAGPCQAAGETPGSTAATGGRDLRRRYRASATAYTTSLSNLALLYKRMGRRASMPLYVQARDLPTVLGERHPELRRRTSGNLAAASPSDGVRQGACRCTWSPATCIQGGAGRPPPRLRRRPLATWPTLYRGDGGVR